MTSQIHSLATTKSTVPQLPGQERQIIVDDASQQVNDNEMQPPSKLDAVVQPSVSKLRQAVDGLNEAFEVVRTHLRFRLHEDTHRYYVEIVDTLANEVVREVPPKRFLDMVADMYQFMGIIVDEKR